MTTILVTGACGFVGSTLIRRWVSHSSHRIIGLDNLARPGSELNRGELRALGVAVQHADLRLASDLNDLPPADVVIDAAASPSVLGGLDGRTSSRQLIEHNLIGTINMLEYCKSRGAALVLLSTSRVYAIAPLAALPVRPSIDAFELDATVKLPAGTSANGVTEAFPTTPPISLYGAAKLASEQLALEYGSAFRFPVWINRCGVMAGAGQFGRADQGIFTFWIHSWLRRRPLQYIGFDGEGRQVRDCMHPRDLGELIDRQLSAESDTTRPRVVNAGGGVKSARSLAQLSAWCRDRLGPHEVESVLEPRTFDVPWMVLDASAAGAAWQWAPSTTTDEICEEILAHAKMHPEWLAISSD